jgi:hypothetical protein
MAVDHEIFVAVTTRQAPVPAAPRVVPPREHERSADALVAVCIGFVVAQTGFRTWALLPSWFYTDDYRLLLQAHSTPFGLDALLKPFDSQFMPAGRLLSYVVLAGGELNWELAALITLALSAGASLACIYMLVTLFGRRWAVVGLLAVYLTSTLTVPALMWWAAALNQVAPQTCFFLAVAWWATYLRSGRTRMAVASLTAVAVGLAFYIKALLVLLVLAYLTLVVFSRGSARQRVQQTWSRHWRVVLPTTAVGAAFVAWYATAVEQAYAGAAGSQIGDVADSMLGRSMPTGLLGGPWQWWNTNPPIVIADPPGWTVHLSWVVLALAVAYTMLRRRAAWTGWALIAGYALIDFGLLATSRGQEYGVFAGLDYRYLTDLAPVAVLGVGLATLTVPHLLGGSEERVPPMVARLPDRVVAVSCVLVCIGGLFSSIGYVHFWHHENAGATYVRNVQSQLRGDGTHELVNQAMPSTVMPGYTNPYNQTENFVQLLSGDVRFPEVSASLELLDDTGDLVPATVKPSIQSVTGPRKGCGWLVRQSVTEVPLESTAFDWGWWIEVRYLAAEATTLAVTTGGTTAQVPFRRGLGSVMVHVTDTFDSVVLKPTDGVAVCVDSIAVGDVVPR